MTTVHLQALLPDTNGIGWFAVVNNGGNRPPPRCSIRGCLNPAVCYHRAVHGRTKVYRNQHRCAEHLPPSIVIRGGRVWLNQGVE